MRIKLLTHIALKLYSEELKPERVLEVNLPSKPIANRITDTKWKIKSNLKFLRNVGMMKSKVGKKYQRKKELTVCLNSVA